MNDEKYDQNNLLSSNGFLKISKRIKTPLNNTQTPHMKAHALLTQSQTFIESAHAEIHTIDSTIKNLNHVIDSFHIILDKQVHLCSDIDGFQIARVKADLMDLIENMKRSSLIVENTSKKFQKIINHGKKNIKSHHINLQKQFHGKIIDKIQNENISLENSIEEISLQNLIPMTLYEILFPNQNEIIPQENIILIMDKIGFRNKISITKKELLFFFREMIHWCLVNNDHITVLERTNNKNYSTRYASILTTATWDEFHIQKLIQENTIEMEKFESFLNSNLFQQLVKIVSSKINIQTISPTKLSIGKELNAAEHTLSMAKLLNDLANAETEAKNGFKLSVRTNSARTKQFSKAFLHASKELLDKETNLY